MTETKIPCLNKSKQFIRNFGTHNHPEDWILLSLSQDLCPGQESARQSKSDQKEYPETQISIIKSYTTYNGLCL